MVVVNRPKPVLTAFRTIGGKWEWQARSGMSVFLFIIVIVGLVTAGEVVSKALDQRNVRPPIEPAGEAEVARLRDQVESLSTEVQRLTEEQRFMTRLLESSTTGPAVSGAEDAGAGATRGPQAQG